MSKIGLKEVEANSFNLGNLFHTIKIRGTGLNNNALSYFNIDNSVNQNTNSRGITVTFFDEDMKILSKKTFDVYGNTNTRYDLGNSLKYGTGYNFFIITSYDAIGTNQHLDDCMSDVGANFWFVINRVFDYNGIVVDFNNANGSHRTPYAAFGTSENGIIYETIGSSTSGALKPHAELTVSIPHKSQRDKLLINGVNPSFVKYNLVLNSSVTFSGNLKKKYQEYVRFVCNYKSIGTVGYRIRLFNSTGIVVNEYTGSMNSNIVCDESILLGRNDAVSYEILFNILPSTQLKLNYATISYSCIDNRKGANNTSFSMNKYGSMSSYDIIENYIGFSPFDKESYLKIYNSKTNLIKTVFDSKNNSSGYFFNSSSTSPCYFNNNTTYETPYIELLRNDIYYYFSMFNKCYNNCSVYIKTYDSDYNLLNTIRTSNNTQSNNHLPLVVNGDSDERNVGLNEFFILPEDADSVDKSFFDDIQNTRYGSTNNTGVHLPSSSYTVKYKRETKYFKLIFSGTVKIFNPILTPLLPSISTNGNIYMGSFKEGINISGTKRRVLTMAEDVNLGINSTVGGYTIMTTANLLTIGASILANEIFPAGMIVNFPGLTIPSGWLKCNGVQLNRHTYPRLFSALGYRYGGSGDYFNLPDMRGEFVRGWDDSRGVDSGRTIGSTQDDLYRSHNHSGSTSSDGGHHHGWTGKSGTGYPDGWKDTVTAGTTNKSYPKTTQQLTAGEHIHSLSINNSGGTETRPRNVALQFMIKY